MGTEAGDPRHQSNATAPMLAGEGSREQTTAALVGGREESIDRTMDLGGQAFECRRQVGHSHAEPRRFFLGDTSPYPFPAPFEDQDIVTTKQATYY